MTSLNIVAIADDLEENRCAVSLALKELYPSIQVFEFDSAKSIIDRLSQDVTFSPELILTDVSMETPMAGFFVTKIGWSWGIPTVMVTGGVKTHTNDQVELGYPDRAFYGEKNDSNLWKKMIAETILYSEVEGGYNNAILRGLHHFHRRGGRFSVQDLEHGEICARVMTPHICKCDPSYGLVR
jgi:hypothetical protein